MDEELTKEDLQNALDTINDNINSYFEDMNGSINSIDTNVSEINDNLNEYFILNQPIEKEEKENEQETKEDDKKEDEKLTKDGEQEQQEEVLTLSDINASIEEVNESITLTNQILTGNILFMGVIVGVLLFKILWDRLKK